MWTWDVSKVNIMHSLKGVQDLRIFRDIAILLVDEEMRWSSKIAKRLGLNGSTLGTYRLQGRVCSGKGGWCSGGNDCLGRFRMWYTYWSPTKRSYELVEDHHCGSFEAAMLKICLKAVPHFLEFCQILSYGAHITRQHDSYQFRVFQREKKPFSVNEWQLEQYIRKRLRARFEKDIQIPYENVDRFVLWVKSLGIISRNPTFGRLEFRVKTFEKYLDRKKIFSDFSEDRSIMEGLP